MRRFLALVTLGALLTTSLALATAVAAKAPVRMVQMLDACDPATFNELLGEGACVRPGGGVTVEAFIGQLQTLGMAPSWRFSPGFVTLAEGGSIVALNGGGEAHSFTEVDEFGGGCVDELNAILGFAGPAPGLDCMDPVQLFGTLAAPGESVETSALTSGEHKFLCWIHPWMRATVRAS